MLEILRARAVEFDAIDYTEKPLHEAELERIADGLSEPPSALVRHNNAEFRELRLSQEQYQSKAAVVWLLREHPQLMQRPIVLSDDLAIIARPPHLVEQLL